MRRRVHRPYNATPCRSTCHSHRHAHASCAAPARTIAPTRARCWSPSRTAARSTIRGAPDHPPTGGTLCTKVARYLDRTYSPERVLHPMRRVGRKGEGRFARITWDEALDEIADALRARSPRRPTAAGDRAVQLRRHDGAAAVRLDGPALLPPPRRVAARPHDLRDRRQGRLGRGDRRVDRHGRRAVREQPADPDLGQQPVTSNLHFWTRAQEAKRRGARLIAIDPYRSATAEKCHEHIALLPGTDAALALGLMHVLIAEDLVDRDYIERYTLGFDALRGARRRVAARARRARSAASRPSRSIALARDYGTITAGGDPRQLRHAARTPAAATRCARSPACRRWSAPGAIRPAARCCRPRAPIRSTRGARAARPDPRHAAHDQHVARSATRCSTRRIRRSARSTSTTPTRSPSRRSRRRSRAGFAREDLFCVVHEIFQTDTADYADILLPATTQLEQFDVHKSYGHLYVLANNPAIAPLGEALPNTEVFRRLAARMGFAEPCFRDTDDDLARQAFRRDDPRARGLDWDALKRDGWQRLAVPAAYAPFAEGGFPTPSGKCEFYSATLAAQGTIRCRRSSRRANRRRATRSWRGAIRWRSSRRRRATSSTRRSPTCRRSSPRRRRRGSTSIRTTRARAASRPATACASSTTAAASPPRRASATARDPAWSSRRRSGGRSCRRTARTPTR